MADGRDEMEQEMTVEHIEATARLICLIKGYNPDMPVNERQVQWQTFTELARATVARIDGVRSREADPAVPQDVADQWTAFDRVLNMLNGLDVEGLTADEMRRKIYGEVMSMKPALSQQPSPVAVGEVVCRHEPYQGACAHCGVPFRDGRPVLAALARTGQGYGREIEPTEAMIEAGEDQLEKCAADLREENYIPGKTPDWDYGMEAEAVYRAMEAARVKFLAAPLDGEG